MSVPVLESYRPQTPSLLVPPRIEASELLDLGAGSAQDVEQNFADLWRINAYLGGLRAITAHLYPRLRQQKTPLNVIDIGSGSADIALQISQWSRRNQIDLRIWALDLSARNLAVAHRHTTSEARMALLQADALHLPLRAESVDYCISSLFLHHLTPEQIIMFLAQTFAASKKGIIMSDVVRGWLPLLLFKLGQPIFARSFLTRYDGAVSIRRAYTPDELLQMARSAGLSAARVHQHFPWRMTLVVDK